MRAVYRPLAEKFRAKIWFNFIINLKKNDDVIIVGETKPNKNQETSHTPVQEQTKNAFAPGTRMTYSEATKRGAKIAAQESTERSLQETLQTVVLTMQELIKSI